MFIVVFPEVSSHEVHWILSCFCSHEW